MASLLAGALVGLGLVLLQQGLEAVMVAELVPARLEAKERDGNGEIVGCSQELVEKINNRIGLIEPGVDGGPVFEETRPPEAVLLHDLVGGLVLAQRQFLLTHISARL